MRTHKVMLEIATTDDDVMSVVMTPLREFATNIFSGTDSTTTTVVLTTAQEEREPSE